MDRRHGQRNRNHRSVLPAANGLEMRDGLAGPYPAEHHVIFGLAIGRDDHPNGLPDGFGGEVTEHALGGPIPRGDDSVEVLTDDSVVRRFHHSGEMADRERVGNRLHKVGKPLLESCAGLHTTWATMDYRRGGHGDDAPAEPSSPGGRWKSSCELVDHLAERQG